MMNEVPPSQERLSRILMSMMGDTSLVNRWWNTPNKFWNGETPYTVFQRDPINVRNYIWSYLDK